MRYAIVRTFKFHPTFGKRVVTETKFSRFDFDTAATLYADLMKTAPEGTDVTIEYTE